MINRLHALFHKPEDGWDPVPSDHATWYADFATNRFQGVDVVDRWVGSLAGKEVLDLGGGPGQCSVELAKRGARVTWHDPSQRYMRIAKARAEKAGLQVDFSLGYLDHASRLGLGRFDLVFNQVCWCYCMADRPFAQLIYDLLRPGGSAYVETDLSTFKGDGASAQPLRRRLAQRAYVHLGLKIGHPHPPRGRIAQLFQAFPLERIEIDYSTPDIDLVLLRKP